MELLAQIPLIGGALGYVVPFLIVLTVIVFVHEFGHYIVGRWCGIHAEVFSIGFGTPLLRRTDRRGTVWQIAAIPLGGYVRFTGDMDPASAGRVGDDDLTPEQRKSAFHNARLLQRTLTVSAGPVANFLLSIVLIAGMAMYQGRPSEEPVVGEVGPSAAHTDIRTGDRIISVAGTEVATFGDFLSTLAENEGAPVTVVVERGTDRLPVTISDYQMARIVEVNPTMPAADVGMLYGDLVVAIDGSPIHTVEELQRLTIYKAEGEPVEVELQREGKRFTVHFVPKMVERKHPVTEELAMLPTMGIILSSVAEFSPVQLPIPVHDAVGIGAVKTWGIISETVKYIGRMIFDGADHSQLGGPIRIAKMSGQVAEQGTSSLILLIALLSTSIGLINLFPIPVLDGGHLMFYAIEAVRRKPVGPAAMKIGTMVGLSLVLLLLVFVTYNDLRWLQ
ncbi:MAG TPA: RIP metalloprotease RseP [Thermohalobaculum sp.]|nr:RIP metalloprotease RseP [Thermohalobaculum sp.]